VPQSRQGRLSLLLECLHEQRVLLVLDNLEALLQEGDLAGRYRSGYAGYGQVLQRVGETAHQSCLMLTSREKPASLVLLEETHSRVRALRLVGLDADAGAQLLAEKGVVGTPQERARLVETYAGNPLALKVVTETISDLFAGEIGPFLRQSMVIFGSIGELLASGSYLYGVQVWDVTARTPRWVSRAHPTRIRRVAWSPDGTRLASGGEDGSLYVWKASDGTLLQRLQGHRGVVYGVVWSPDGTRLASGGGSRGSGEVVLWDTRSGAHCGERLYTIASAPGSVLALDWSPRGELLVSGDSDGRLCWWDVHSGECLMQRQGHQGAIQSLRISPDGHRLASCGDEGTIQVWDLESGERLRRLRRDRPYERLTITGVKGLTQAEIASLRGLGAIEEETLPL